MSCVRREETRIRPSLRPFGLDEARAFETAIGLGLWFVALVGVMRLGAFQPSVAAILVMAGVGALLATAGIADRRDGPAISPDAHLVLDRMCALGLAVVSVVFLSRGEAMAAGAVGLSSAGLTAATLAIRYR